LRRAKGRQSCAIELRLADRLVGGLIFDDDRKAEGWDKRRRQRSHEGGEARNSVAIDTKHLHRVGAPHVLAVRLRIEHEGGLAFASVGNRQNRP
jgi:hypothetical protein